MNEVLKAIKERRSTKSFKSDMVPMEIIDQICEAGKWAANGKGAQAGMIVAVTDKETRDKLSRLNAAVMGADTDPFYGAPVVLVVLADKSVPTYVYDGSLVMGNLMLAAHSLSVGSCWIHRAKQVFDSEEGKAILASLGVEGEWEGVGNCVIGYPAGEPKEPKPRKENWVYKI
ncbi:MAG: nitroreductase [Oscillospiraceae bacterium]|nr:nitroreductase [Oscillospiraceae bacterium]MBP1553475.1 nitroreductase [Oscillospiraceae bacterium]MBQ5325501.1 nitroreductase [Oscillospiraceae bacterium]MBQ7007293.1 nitroreductase [Oscillospiraceae bacterium]